MFSTFQHKILNSLSHWFKNERSRIKAGPKITQTKSEEKQRIRDTRKESDESSNHCVALDRRFSEDELDTEYIIEEGHDYEELNDSHPDGSNIDDSIYNDGDTVDLTNDFWMNNRLYERANTIDFIVYSSAKMCILTGTSNNNKTNLSMWDSCKINILLFLSLLWLPHCESPQKRAWRRRMHCIDLKVQSIGRSDWFFSGGYAFCRWHLQYCITRRKIRTVLWMRLCK